MRSHSKIKLTGSLHNSRTPYNFPTTHCTQGDDIGEDDNIDILIEELLKIQLKITLGF